MSSTFKIMSFLSKGLPEGPLSLASGGGGEGGEGWERDIFKASKKPKREAVVLRESFIKRTSFLRHAASFTYASTA